MRAQTSIEFMMIAGAIAAFSAFAIGIFGNVLHGQHAILSQALNSTRNASVQFQGQAPASNYSVYAYLSLPSVAYLNRSNTAYLVVSAPSGSRIDALLGGNATLLPSAYFNVSSYGVSELSFTFVPSTFGSLGMEARVNVTYLNRSTSSTATGITFAESPSAPGLSGANQSLFATITRHNESVSYNLTGFTSIYNVSEYSHCSWYNFWGSQEPVKLQCNAPYGYWIPSGKCPWDATYCISLAHTGASASTIRAAQSYIYNISLGLYSSGLSAAAVLSDKAGNAVLYSQGRGIGNASVASVDGQGPQPYYDYAVVNASGALRLVNLTAYGQYLQALGNLEATLATYNGTPIDLDSQTIINQSIGTFDAASARLASYPKSSDGTCAIYSTGNTTAVVCKPLSVFYYSMDATAPSSIIGPGQTLSVQGSTISVS